MSQKPKQLDRRDFLLKSFSLGGAHAIFTNPAAQLLEIMATGFVSQAQAQALGAKPRKYLFIPMMGGPLRTTFTPLSPDATDLSKMVRNPMVNTRFTNATTMSYDTVNINGMAWPWLWQFNVARAGGGMRPMRDLQNNMLIIRGLVGISNHGAGQKARYFPSSIPYTFGSLVSDASTASIPAINVNSEEFHFVSRKSKAAVNLPSGGNLARILLDGLTLPRRNFHTISVDNRTVKNVLDAVSAKLDALSLSESAGFEVSSQALKSAKEIMERGFGDLDTVYNGLVAKYRDICQRTCSQTGLVGINDQPIGSAPATRGLAYQSVSAEPDRTIRNADMRTMITRDTRAINLAEHFALAEFALLNGLSDNITLGLLRFGGLAMQYTAGTGTQVSFDEHNVGSVTTLLVNTFSNLAMGACLLELIDQLKARNLFNETMIDYSGEMGRNPRNTEGGSDHGGEALDVAMWSGALGAAPQVVGDVLARPPASYSYAGESGNLYPGSWGYGAPNAGVGTINQGHLAATQAQILRVENPVRSVSSLVTETGGVIRSFLPTGRIR